MRAFSGSSLRAAWGIGQPSQPAKQYIVHAMNVKVIVQMVNITKIL
jgi:hypothetical protein